MKTLINILIIIILCNTFTACKKNITGRYVNVTVSSDTIIIKKIRDYNYQIIRGQVFSETGEMKFPKTVDVRIDGAIMNYNGRNLKAFSDDFEIFEFDSSKFRKVD